MEPVHLVAGGQISPTTHTIPIMIQIVIHYRMMTTTMMISMVTTMTIAKQTIISELKNIARSMNFVGVSNDKVVQKVVPPIANHFLSNNKKNKLLKNGLLKDNNKKMINEISMNFRHFYC